MVQDLSKTAIQGVAEGQDCIRTFLDEGQRQVGGTQAGRDFIRAQ